MEVIMEDFENEMPDSIPWDPSLAGKKQAASLASISLTLGIISLICSPCIYLSIVCGSLGIIFAILSKGSSMKMPPQSKAGTTICSLGLLSTCLLYGFCFLVMYNTYGTPEKMMEAVMEEYSQIYGEEETDQLMELFGISDETLNP